MIVVVVMVMVEQHSWKLVPKRTVLLSAEAYERRTLGFEVTVVAHMQQGGKTSWCLVVDLGAARSGVRACASLSVST